MVLLHPPGWGCPPHPTPAHLGAQLTRVARLWRDHLVPAAHRESRSAGGRPGLTGTTPLLASRTGQTSQSNQAGPPLMISEHRCLLRQRNRLPQHRADPHLVGNTVQGRLRVRRRGEEHGEHSPGTATHPSHPRARRRPASRSHARERAIPSPRPASTTRSPSRRSTSRPEPPWISHTAGTSTRGSLTGYTPRTSHDPAPPNSPPRTAHRRAPRSLRAGGRSPAHPGSPGASAWSGRTPARYPVSAALGSRPELRTGASDVGPT